MIDAMHTPRSYDERGFVMTTKASRMSVLAGAVADRILDAVRSGAKQGDAAKAGGITREWLNKLLARGRRQPESLYGAFARDYAEAEVAAARDRIAAFKANLQPKNG